MKYVAKIFSVVAIIIFCTAGAEAAELNFVAKKFVTPPRVQRLFPPSKNTPRKEYFPRQTFRPRPHYLPRVPQPSYDNRGGNRKNFKPPQAPHR